VHDEFLYVLCVERAVLAFTRGPACLSFHACSPYAQHMRTHANMYTCDNNNYNTYMHIHARAYTHTHTHTHTHSLTHSLTHVRSTQQCLLRTLPLLLDQYTPDMSLLPMFLLRLATEVCMCVRVRVCVWVCGCVCVKRIELYI